MSVIPADSGAPINLETYYTEAGMDYRAWSRGFNMHFGFWRWPQNPFALEAMLEEMSRQVFRRLAPADGDRLLDLGSGVGAPARALIAGHSVAVTAVTRVPWQIAMAHNLGPGIAPRGTVDWLLADYTATGLPSTFYQGAFSIEASCHAAGVDKELFVRECARLLVPGARLVVADGFMRRSDGMPRWYAALLRFMTRSWAVDCFADLDAFCSMVAQRCPGLDYLFFGDWLATGHDLEFRDPYLVARIDPISAITYLAGITERIGLIATANTSYADSPCASPAGQTGSHAGPRRPAPA